MNVEYFRKGGGGSRDTFGENDRKRAMGRRFKTWPGRVAKRSTCAGPQSNVRAIDQGRTGLTLCAIVAELAHVNSD